MMALKVSIISLALAQFASLHQNALLLCYVTIMNLSRVQAKSAAGPLKNSTQTLFLTSEKKSTHVIILYP